MTRVLIAHISDLHFAGSFFPSWGQVGAPVTPTQPPAIAGVPGVQGFYPHDPLACLELENLLKDELRRTPADKVFIAVTGDLTASGDDSEFVMALTYLRSRVQQEWHLRVGLGKLPIRPEVVAVPGNHDHWGGTRAHFLWRAGPAQGIHGVYFDTSRHQPYWHRTYPVGNLHLQLMGVDSCSRAVPTGHKVARGYLDRNDLVSLGAEIVKADGWANSSGKKIVRLLLIHHSFDANPLHAYDDQSKKHLEDFCQKYHVSFVLAGHTHEPKFPPSPPQYGQEFRCGTSLQGAFPGWSPSRYGNTVLLHLLEEEANSVFWSSRSFQRPPSGTFTEAEVYPGPAAGRAPLSGS